MDKINRKKGREKKTAARLKRSEGKLKALMAVNELVMLAAAEKSLDESLRQVCEVIPGGFNPALKTKVRIQYKDKTWISRGFKETGSSVSEKIKTLNDGEAVLELFFSNNRKPAKKTQISPDPSYLNNISSLLSDIIAKSQLRKLLHDKTEREKELRGLSRTAESLKRCTKFEDALQQISESLPDAWQYPESTAVRITFQHKHYKSSNFKETQWKQSQEFFSPDKKRGVIEVFYLKKLPEEDEGPFLRQERELLINIANLIAGSAAKDVYNKLEAFDRERLKELAAINNTSAIIAEGKPVEETLQKIVAIIPASWQYPAYTTARICFEEKCYSSREFTKTSWVQKENFTTIDSKRGSIEVYYLKEFPDEYEGPFLKEERDLLINLAKLISGYLNNFKGREIINYRETPDRTGISKPDQFRNSLIKNKPPLQLFFNKQAIDKYIYLDMMKYKVKHILFVATLYDAFILENEDSFFERFMGEIYQFSLFSLPRITCVTSDEEALEILDTTNFDLVILMVGVESHVPVQLSRDIKKKRPDLPVYLLLNRKSNIKRFEELVNLTPSIDKLFVWGGHSEIFFAIVKSIEDNANAENDTRVGLIRIILLIEDSAQYYSKYLRILYTIVFDQIQKLIPEVEKNELDKIAKTRSRPKILHARNYEDAMFIFNKYKDFMLCVISDVEFEREGTMDKTAGIKFIKYAKSQIKNLPIILQSSEKSNAGIARNLKVSYLNKNSDSLLNDIKKFLMKRMFFGDFVFKDKEGNTIGTAKSLREFEMLLHKVPGESIYLHGRENQFSLWLMSRGEIELARKMNPVKVSDFGSMEELRKDIITEIIKYREEKKRGKTLDFDETLIIDEKNIVRFAGGSFGGKGRGLAFINSLINNVDFSSLSKEINIRAPITAIIGTNEFESFMERNHLYDVIYKSRISYRKIQQHFLKAHLSSSLIKKLEAFLDQIHKPIAIRSSSLSEDSITMTFAGVFDTYIIPNNQKYKKARLEMLQNAIKLVYSSIYADSARTYFKAIGHKIEDERMAIALQELVGNQFGNYYYPHISGTAQSYNYYPVAYMKPEEGFATAAVGLGFYVVTGRKSYRFSQKYPDIEIFSKEDLVKSTQTNFLAVDLSKKNIDLFKDGEFAALKLLDISEAEKNGSLKHCASVYNPDNDRIESGLNSPGPRIINFADILKFNYIPLAQTIDVMLNIISDALGSPVEIEYAVDLNKITNNLPSFFLLQVKPLIGDQLEDEDGTEINKEKAILYTESSLGNGVIQSIQDVIYIDVDRFDKMKTLEMAKEIEQLNHIMIEKEKKYILIGPGRWGTRDPYLGIPVNWSQISNAKVIVETSLENYPLDSSLGSHFFHNITSMSIGYFSILDTSKTDFIKWDILDKQHQVNRTEHFRHIRFEKPLNIIMKGKQKTSAVLIKE